MFDDGSIYFRDIEMKKQHNLHLTRKTEQLGYAQDKQCSNLAARHGSRHSSRSALEAPKRHKRPTEVRPELTDYCPRLLHSCISWWPSGLN